MGQLDGYGYELDTLLVLTRDHELNDNLIELLAREPYKLEFCHRNNSFLQIILRRPILVCVFDLGRVRREKLEILQVITRVKPDVSLILIAGDTSENMARKIHLNRIHYYLQKPVNLEELLIAIRSAFEFHRRNIYARGW